MKNKLAAIILATVSGIAMAGDGKLSEENAKIYRSSCAMCHQTGAGGAPMLGVDDWKVRKKAAGGMDGLVANVKSGMGAMPPGGMCTTCTDENYEAIIKFMMKKPKKPK